MIIKPEHEPRLFIKIFGQWDDVTSHPSTIFTQKERVRAWDAAIEFVMLRQPLQKPVLLSETQFLTNPNQKEI